MALNACLDLYLRANDNFVVLSIDVRLECSKFTGSNLIGKTIYRNFYYFFSPVNYSLPWKIVCDPSN